MGRGAVRPPLCFFALYSKKEFRQPIPETSWLLVADIHMNFFPKNFSLTPSKLIFFQLNLRVGYLYKENSIDSIFNIGGRGGGLLRPCMKGLRFPLIIFRILSTYLKYDFAVGWIYYIKRLYRNYIPKLVWNQGFRNSCIFQSLCQSG